MHGAAGKVRCGGGGLNVPFDHCVDRWGDWNVRLVWKYALPIYIRFEESITIFSNALIFSLQPFIGDGTRSSGARTTTSDGERVYVWVHTHINGVDPDNVVMFTWSEGYRERVFCKNCHIYTCAP